MASMGSRVCRCPLPIDNDDADGKGGACELEMEVVCEWGYGREQHESFRSNTIKMHEQSAAMLRYIYTASTLVNRRDIE